MKQDDIMCRECGKHWELLFHECPNKVKVPTSLRRKQSEILYQEAKKNGGTIPLGQEPHKVNYTHWKIIANRFPYDLVYKTHDMLIPRREFATRYQMNVAEQIELEKILDDLSKSDTYDLVFENFGARRSIKVLYHVHLAKYKQRA